MIIALLLAGAPGRLGDARILNADPHRVKERANIDIRCSIF
jgi:hypothetical protein